MVSGSTSLTKVAPLWRLAVPALESVALGATHAMPCLCSLFSYAHARRNDTIASALIVLLFVQMLQLM